ncbi:MerR family transcriptional regulator [Streptomyces sp. NBC_00069]|uniref:MerR family transcriptional regulator n=1 Tax=Streptomyces sp. NBC_00069 TaxID=2975639 RepID=UPI003865DD99
MRIGEIAALVGVTTRAIRRYHQVGLLPEPERRLGAPPSGGWGALGPVAADPAVLAPYERLDELADAAVDDPRIPPLAAAMVAAVPDGVFDAIPADGGAAGDEGRPGGARGGGGPHARALTEAAAARAARHGLAGAVGAPPHGGARASSPRGTRDRRPP